MNTTTLSIYHNRAGQFRAEQRRYAKNLFFTSMLRLALFLVFAWFIYTAFKVRFAGYNLLYALAAIVGLIIVIFVAANIKKKIDFLQQLISINENEIAVNNGLPSFLDNGIAFSPSNGFSVDLNVFGKHSLFHALNRTGSLPGKESLAACLAQPLTRKTDIENIQGCVKELSDKILFRQTFLAHTLLFKEEDSLVQLQSGILIKDFSFLQNQFWNIASVAWPLGGISVITYGIITGSYLWVLPFIFIGILFSSLIGKKINLLYLHISKRSYLYTQYARCFYLIGNEKFDHPHLLEMQVQINHAAGAFKKLSALTSLFDLRLSLLSFFLNGLFLFDLLCAKAYLRWNERNQPDMKTWFDTLGEMEKLNSLATFYYNHPSFVFPGIAEEQPFVKATGMGHPLMKETVAVVNDISIGEPSKLHLITGSNMSGKSTFLRTLGLNLILAQAGAPVFAQTFLFCPVRLLTSFHHIDSLEESTSYFYAELKCLQEIIQSLQQPVPALVLLDEVMRGTNSKDKHDGTALLIKKLLTYRCLALIATHDTELGILADDYPAKVENYCFESDLKNDELYFDFMMRKGVAQTKNATFLMRKMGIV